MKPGNPFKKSKWQRIKDILEDPECEKWEDDEEKPNPISTVMNNNNEFIRSAKTLVEIAEISKERKKLKEELRVLREDLEKLKEKEVPNFIEGDNEICNWLNCKGEKAEILKEKQEAINKIHEIMRQSLATKECCKEKPKESEELKIKWNHSELSIEENKLLKYLNLRINDGRDNCSIPIEKPDAIKIINYLKKHFEI